ncbi:hypothetical protein DSO57_1019368 [Entomophthora muscae]|nr:hypothetical protein DSO57_1019368 [Entomophthora muscae]
MHDLFGEEISKHELILKTATDVATLHGYTKIATPALEYTNLFHQGLGEDSEVVVGKELYSFFDEKSQVEVALRPEGTAGVMRAIGLGELHRSLPLRLFYNGAFFRHERPQKGRLRQFHQFGVEQLGPDHPAADVEMIAMGYSLLSRLGIDTRLRIHSLGTSEERNKYIQHLRAFLLQRRDQLSALSQSRIESNALRILDSKSECDQAALLNAPKLLDFLGSASRTRFDFVTAGLKSLKIPFEIDTHLVRGLDYYQHTVWEFEARDSLGVSQATVLGGGRYDGLLEKIIGRKDNTAIPAIGWACGIERLSLLLPPVSPSFGPVHIIPITEPALAICEAVQVCQALAYKLRASNIPVVVSHPSFSLPGSTMNVTKIVKKLTRPHSTAPIPGYLLFIGSSEVASGQVKVRNVQTHEESEVSLSNLAIHFASVYA